jgi:hypothetical protein
VVPPAAPAANAPVGTEPRPARPASAALTILGIPLPLFIGLGIGLILLLGFIVFVMTRKLQHSPNRAMAYVSGRTVSSSRPVEEAPRTAAEGSKNTDLLASYAAGQRKGSSVVPPRIRPIPEDMEEPVFNGPVLLSLFVDDQNTNIGRRNVHSLKAGNVYTLGGGNSDYRIFLVPLPPHIGEIQFNGRQCSFVPKKPQYFPDLGSQSVPNCIGKTIRIISDKRYELTFRMVRYEDPLAALNRLLNSVSVAEK